MVGVGANSRLRAAGSWTEVSRDADDVVDAPTSGTDGDDVLQGGTGSDVLVGRGGRDTINGGDGDDTLFSANEHVSFGYPYSFNYRDNPTLDTGAEADSLTGGAGSDRIFAGYNDSVHGGSNGTWSDILYLSLLGATTGVTMDFTQASVANGTGTIQGIEDVDWLQGSNFDDNFILPRDSGVVYAMGGNDRVVAGYHTTHIFGGDGDDYVDTTGSEYIRILDGGAGDDTLITRTNEIMVVTGGTGNDTISAPESFGGSGDDRITILSSNYGQSGFGEAGDDQITGTVGENELSGGSGADVLRGGNWHDTLYSAGSDDAQTGGLGSEIDTGTERDQLFGEGGNDRISIGYGDDADGGAGTNSLALSLLGATGGVTLDLTDLTNGNAYVLGGGTIRNFQSVVMLWGSNFADTLTLSVQSSPMHVYGMDGDDVIHGSSGADYIHGGAGADTIHAGDGNDTIYLDAATEIVAGEQIHGGAGSDTLIVGGNMLVDISTLVTSGIERLETTGTTMLGLSQTLLDGVTTLRGRFALTGPVTLDGITAAPGVVTWFYLNNDGGNLDMTGFAATDTVRVTGGIRDDLVIGSSANEMLEGGVGNDDLRGQDGLDYVSGGEGNDDLDGGAGNDNLNGGNGDDRLDGGTGADEIYGGMGNDTYVVDHAGDAPWEYQAQGDDLVISSISFQLWQHIERLTLTGSAGINGTGNELANTIIGNGAANRLDGSHGDDILRGLDGADTLLGGEGRDVLEGGSGADVLEGGNHHDTLDGGLDADRMVGGAGNDTFYVDRQDDLVFEDVGGGTDTVISTGSFYLYANVENLTLAGSGDNFGVGNELANTILGNGGSNLLIAGAGDDIVRGGGGVDSLFGQDGNDQLFGDAGIDYLVGGIGNDTLDGGDDADALYGEDGDDILIGGSSFSTDILVGGAGNDVLRGDSGLGDYDLMDGGAGNDSYYVDTPDDLTFEAANGGTDTVYATINGAGYYLYANVENLVLGGDTPFGVGNELNNRITGSAASNWLLGGAGNDVLNGRGGNDVLFGEADADIFVFERGTGGDVIGDFVAGTDRIDLSAFGFTSFAQVEAVLGEQGGTAFLTLGNGDMVVLNGVARAALSAGDFILASAGDSKVPVMEPIDVDPRPDLIHDFVNPRLFVDVM